MGVQRRRELLVEECSSCHIEDAQAESPGLRAANCSNRWLPSLQMCLVGVEVIRFFQSWWSKVS
jgi:hypothetical protein